MAKQAGMGDNLYVDGIDLSGDVGSLSRIGGGPSPLDVTGINQSAFDRLGGLRDGGIDFTAFFNPAEDTGAHVNLSTLPRTDRIVTYCRGTALGGQGAALIGKQINYDPTRGADGSLTIGVQAVANGFGLEWGNQLTAGIDTLTEADDGTGVDFGVETDLGLQAYLHVFAFTGTSATVTIEDSDDDGTDPYAAVTGAAFTAASAIGAQRIQTARDENVKQWLRVAVTGTFSDLDFAVLVVRNLTATVF